MSPLVRTLTIALTVATTFAVLSLPAQAARLVLEDPAGDTWTADSPAAPAGSARNTDLRRTVIVHGSERVTVRARYEELLRPRRGETLSLAVRLRTSAGAQRNAFVVARRSSPRGLHTLVVERSKKAVRCPGLRHAVSYPRNTISLSIPRSCLGNPRWVRAMVVVLDLDTDGSGTVDDAASSGAEATTWTKRLRRAR